MVRGLERFKNHFSSYTNRYVLIGGTACTLLMEDAGLEFRATKDLDIVLYVEAIDTDFVSAFWAFITEGGYQNRQRSTGKNIFYRFYSPRNKNFPAMLELFSRVPDIISLADDSYLTPIPTDEATMSLSAILLDDDYYRFICLGQQDISGVSVVESSYLIPLKAKAWLDLMNNKKSGKAIDEKNIRKHKNDIMRLYQLLSLTTRISMPTTIKEDMKKFLNFLGNEPVDMKNLGLKQISLNEVVENFRLIYNL